MTHTTEQLAAFSATTAAEQLIIKNAVTELINRLGANTEASQALADSGPVVSPATKVDEKTTMDAVRNSRVFKINQAKVDPVLLALFEDIMSRAVAEKISGIKAVQMVISAHPQATRVAIKHTAALVGINPLSARNTYDHIKNDKN